LVTLSPLNAGCEIRGAQFKMEMAYSGQHENNRICYMWHKKHLFFFKARLPYCNKTRPICNTHGCWHESWLFSISWLRFPLAKKGINNNNNKKHKEALKSPIWVQNEMKIQKKKKKINKIVMWIFCMLE
jgi:hypothetical protein